MQKFIPFLFLLLFFHCDRSQDSATNQDEIQTEDSDQKILTDSLQALSEESIIPGFGVAVVTKDGPLYQAGFGLANIKDQKAYTSQTTQPIASVSKTFVGVALMVLWDQGKLDLDELINDILGYEVNNPFYPDTPITIRHLSSHTSSLNDDFDDLDESIYWLLEPFNIEQGKVSDGIYRRMEYFSLGSKMTFDESIQFICSPEGKWYEKANFEEKPPGSSFLYNNIGPTIAARIIELKSGMAFKDFTQKYIFAPLEMNNTGWYYQGVSKETISDLHEQDDLHTPPKATVIPKYTEGHYPSSMLTTSVEDISLYLVEVINGMQGNGKLLSAEAYQILLNPQLKASQFEEERSDFIFDDEYNYGVFWAISEPGYRLHNGGMDGIYSFLFFDPKTQVGAFGMTNLPGEDIGKIRRWTHEYMVKAGEGD